MIGIQKNMYGRGIGSGWEEGVLWHFWEGTGCVRGARGWIQCQSCMLDLIPHISHLLVIPPFLDLWVSWYRSKEIQRPWAVQFCAVHRIDALML